MQAQRTTVDLTAYPDLMVVMLGFRLRGLRAIPAMMAIGKGLGEIARRHPDGLLHHEGFLFGWNHVGIRQYWRDPAALAAFTRSEPHGGWWRSFLRDPKQAGFWHEAYSMRGGMEAIYVNMPDGTGIGMTGFAPARDAGGAFMTAAGRMAAARG
ncbi:monooxygenase family protein [Sphingomonas beigongshangi]|jgi:hypothetical protein|uniref:monooxygenase family protein n=1 Tax=Sphingomonas beigongshangi TaxID=2782540 RepID=UPI001AEE1DB3|nr:DUF4188 domain-containing protein [Sphingomonas beigongshangi]